MKKNAKNIKIIFSPFKTEIEVVIDKIVLKPKSPFSDNSVTIIVNPNILGYQKNLDQQNAKIRQVTRTGDTEDTKYLHFDFSENNIHKIEMEGEEYEIRLMEIGKENIKGQDFPCFEFFIQW